MSQFVPWHIHHDLDFGLTGMEAVASGCVGRQLRPAKSGA